MTRRPYRARGRWLRSIVSEGAYYHDRSSNRAAYLEAYVNNIDWRKVDSRFERYVPAQHKERDYQTVGQR